MDFINKFSCRQVPPPPRKQSYIAQVCLIEQRIGGKHKNKLAHGLLFLSQHTEKRYYDVYYYISVCTYIPILFSNLHISY